MKSAANSVRKLFVVVRDDLSISQQAVQSGHALAELLLHNTSHDWTNGTLIFLKTNDLAKVQERLDFHKQDFHTFYEPDLNNEATAIASLADAKYFKSYKLL